MRHHISAIKNQRRLDLPAEDNGGMAMLSITIKRVSMLVALALVLTASAFAQTGPIEGTVTVKGADGVAKPVEGATVTIYRTDIAGKWDVKTDKAGRYVRLGMPIAGTFIVVASGPGMQPFYLNNIRLIQTSVVNIVANEGDGSTLTLDQVKQLLAGAKSGAPAPTTPQQPSAADKAKMDKENAEYEKKVKESKAIQEAFDQARVRYNGGIELMKASKYSAALPEFEAATGVDTSKNVELLRLAYKANANIAEAHYQVGVDLFNKKQKPEAKEHFEKATASVGKAIELAATDTAEPNINNDLLVYYGIYAKNAALLVEHYGQADKVPNSVVILDKASALDATNKNKWAVMKGDLYRFAGMSDEAATAYKAVIAADPVNIDAMYGLGLTLIASQETKVIQEGANALGDFVAKAPATDRRVPAVKEALEAVKNAYKIEAEKPSKRKPGGKP
jgi:tetratricopeptide (TPR) repeat protein